MLAQRENNKNYLLLLTDREKSLVHKQLVQPNRSFRFCKNGCNNCERSCTCLADGFVSDETVNKAYRFYWPLFLETSKRKGLPYLEKNSHNYKEESIP